MIRGNHPQLGAEAGGTNLMCMRKKYCILTAGPSPNKEGWLGSLLEYDIMRSEANFRSSFRYEKALEGFKKGLL